MTRSMAPTLAKLDSMAIRTASEISGSNYRAGYEAGKAHAYRRIAYTLTAIALCAGIVWMVV